METGSATPQIRKLRNAPVRPKIPRKLATAPFLCGSTSARVATNAFMQVNAVTIPSCCRENPAKKTTRAVVADEAPIAAPTNSTKVPTMPTTDPAINVGNDPTLSAAVPTRGPNKLTVAPKPTQTPVYRAALFGASRIICKGTDIATNPLVTNIAIALYDKKGQIDRKSFD